MTKKRKIYTENFKSEAVKMMEIHGVTKAAADLGVSPVTLRKWETKEKVDTPSTDDLDLKKENKRLQKENQYLKKINEVLKKSTAIFSQDEFPPFK
jgi:transposase-like protein